MEKGKVNKDEILIEISECREDERSAQNQMIQVIATAGTILAFIFGASTFTDTNKSVLFHLSNFILCTAFGYITSLGMGNVLRYHYIESLEDKLYKIANEEDNSDFIHWMSFSTAITTRNPLHLCNKYSKLHYIYYALATICPIVFCILVTIIQYVLLEKYSIVDKIGILFLSFFIIMSLVAFFYSSIKARNMYDEAVKISIEKRRKRDKEGVDSKRTGCRRDILSVFLYFIYPKMKDIQKIFLLILGFFTGIFFLRGNIKIILDEILNLSIVLIVVEILIYQARYQWNDIRGVRGDIEDGRTDRLPVNALGKKNAVLISLGIIFAKVIMAVIIINVVPDELSHQLSVSVITIIICSILYEFMRTTENIFGIFLFVSLGYAVRFGIGVWIAYPKLFNDGIIIADNSMSKIVFVLLLLAYSCLGEFSAILPWTHETTYQIKHSKKMKNHKLFLYKMIKDRCKDGNASDCLKEKGKITDLWNTTYIMAIIFLAIGNLIICKNITILIIELITLTFSIVICISSFNKDKFILISFVIFNVVTSIFLSNNKLVIYINYTQLFFTITYFVLRFLFDPNYNFIVFLNIIVKRVVKAIYILIVGKDTYNYINSDD